MKSRFGHRVFSPAVFGFLLFGFLQSVTCLYGQPEFVATQIYKGEKVYGLAWGEFDPLHSGAEVACLTESGSVLQLSPGSSGWEITLRHEGLSPIVSMSHRPTISIGNVNAGHPGNEIVICAGSLVMTVFPSEVLFDSTGMVGHSWGARAGDYDPGRPGDEIFHIYEGVMDQSTGTIFSESSGFWVENLIYNEEVGMDSAAGDFNPDNPGPEIVVVTEMDVTYEIIPSDLWPKRAIWTSYDNAAWVVKIADIDPCHPGNEIVYGTRYNDSIMMSRHNGNNQPHVLQILFTGSATGFTRTMWDIAVGDVLPDVQGKEILGVDQTGSVYLVSRIGDGWQGQVIWQNPNSPLYAVIAGDFLPDHPGDEILVAGEAGTITLLTLKLNLTGDLTGDKFVNFEDLAVLASQWLQAPVTPSADIAPSPNGDGIVDFLDLAALTDSWMDCFVTQATSPNPSDNAAGISANPVLGWSAGDGALSHDVYLGTDADAVAEANQLSVEFMDTVSQTSFAPSPLAFSTKYYWRIDEIGPLCMAQGTVWSFTTVPPPPEQATNPGPADLATGVSVIADLGWTAGSGATSHDVYFGTFNPGNFQRNQTATTFDPGTLDSNITYYWRIDEKNAGGTTIGIVWSFTTEVILPGQATSPSPADLATGVSVIADLGWTAGSSATSHDVYFGTFSPGNFQRNQTAATFDPGTLDSNATYYWRIDEKNASGTTTGNVWSFTTIADPNFVSWWKLDEISGTIAHDSAGANNGTVYGATWTTGKINGALSFDGASDYVLVGDKLNLEPQNLTLSYWARLNNPSGSLQGGIAKGRIFGDATMYSYKFDFSVGNAGAAVTNTSDVGFGVGAAIGDTDWHMWSMTAGGGSLSIYKDGAVQNTAGYTGTIDYTKRYNSFVIGARENGNYSFNGKIDDVRFYSRVLSASEIQQLYQSGLP